MSLAAGNLTWNAVPCGSFGVPCGSFGDVQRRLLTVGVNSAASGSAAEEMILRRQGAAKHKRR